MAAAPGGEHERADARRNRERILCAAARLIEAHGVDGVSMDEVAAEAGVGKGTLYRRFGDRGSLLRALIDEPERAFQEALIRGAPPLGPGADPVERLHAFGGGMIGLLESHARFIRQAESLGGVKRYTHPVYQGYRAHVAMLLGQILGPGPQTEYLTDCLLAPLGAEPFLYQRDVRGMTLDEMRAGWCRLADAIVGGS
ncbi:TetR/AcrR family transcriptional regulator [Baekduia soli]|uniref:TetR/AcrR family transcriptional regulator n=2 Tax=Baekduia soli TaxID=496014 RepID=A0A5B8UBN7_9ACTN|nr:TetR/AcrR family transcriptional regulator [Baekduia soli]